MPPKRRKGRYAKAKRVTKATRKPSPPLVPKSAPRPKPKLDNLPNEIQQQIYHYLFPDSGPSFYGRVYKADNYKQINNLLRISPAITENLVHTIKMFGDTRLKANIKSRLYVSTFQAKREEGMKWKEADAEAKTYVESFDIVVWPLQAREPAVEL